MKLHKLFNTSEVSMKYYEKMGMKLDRSYAPARFARDKKVDRTVLKKVILDGFKKQMDEL